MFETGWKNDDAVSTDGPLRLARCLGWFSIALGAVELLAPGRLARALGMEGREALIQGYGARELATGLALLSASNPTPFIWGRVAGDALDLLTLVGGLEDGNPKRHNVGVAIAAVAGVTAVDLVCGQQLADAVPDGVERVVRERSGYLRPLAEARGMSVRSDAEPAVAPAG